MALGGAVGYVGSMDDARKILKSRAVFTDFRGTSPLPVHNLLRTDIFMRIAHMIRHTSTRGLLIYFNRRIMVPDIPEILIHGEESNDVPTVLQKFQKVWTI